VSTEKRTFYVSLSLVKLTKMSWNLIRNGPEISLLAAGSPVIVNVAVHRSNPTSGRSDRIGSVVADCTRLSTHHIRRRFSCERAPVLKFNHYTKKTAIFVKLNYDVVYNVTMWRSNTKSLRLIHIVATAWTSNTGVLKSDPIQNRGLLNTVVLAVRALYSLKSTC